MSKSFFDEDPYFIAAATLRSAESYDDFVGAVHYLLIACKRNIERASDITLSSESAEESITSILQFSLSSLGSSVSSGKQNGNADFIFRDSCSRYVWVGEAKILDERYSWSHLFEGVLQVATRYSTGSVDDCHGGLLIYNYRDYADEAIETWKEKFSIKCRESGFRELVFLQNCSQDFGGFYSQHKHHKSGLPYVLAHIPFNLYHMPIDKSSRTSKNRKQSD